MDATVGVLVMPHKAARTLSGELLAAAAARRVRVVQLAGDDTGDDAAVAWASVDALLHKVPSDAGAARRARGLAVDCVAAASALHTRLQLPHFDKHTCPVPMHPPQACCRASRPLPRATPTSM